MHQKNRSSEYQSFSTSIFLGYSYMKTKESNILFLFFLSINCLHKSTDILSISNKGNQRFHQCMVKKNPEQ